MQEPLMQQQMARAATIAAQVRTGTSTREPLVALSLVRLQRPSELRLLLEWLDFHLVQGVGKFVLYRCVLPSLPLLRL